MKPVIYSVEDDVNIQNVVRIALENSGFDVFVFEESESFFARIDREIPDLVLLDIMLPGMDGIKILETLRNSPKWEQVKVMIISAKSSELDKVIGLDRGADDYLVKPFGVLELVSRIKALLRRDHQKTLDSTISVSGLQIIPEDMVCIFQDRRERFTNKEFSLLRLLVENNGKTITRERILESIWGYGFIGESRTVDVHIKEIRKKLKNLGLSKDIIQTRRGIGYKLVL